MKYVDQARQINIKLSALYEQYSSTYLREYVHAFDDPEPPCRINEFGIIDEERYCMEKPVLFVAKETNNWSNDDFAKGFLFREWMKGIALEGVSGKGHVQKHPTMWYNLGRWVMAIHYPDLPVSEIAGCYKSALSEIGKIAFTNVNKVRGGSVSKDNYWQLATSALSGELLRKEIEILSPEIVICCGTFWEFTYHVPNFSGKVIDMPHPGARISREKMLVHLRTQLEKA